MQARRLSYVLMVVDNRSMKGNASIGDVQPAAKPGQYRRADCRWRHRWRWQTTVGCLSAVWPFRQAPHHRRDKWSFSYSGVVTHALPTHWSASNPGRINVATVRHAWVLGAAFSRLPTILDLRLW